MTPGLPANPTCQRLEAQLTSLDRGNSDPARAERIRRTEDALNRQQNEVDRLVAQGRQNNCERSGFFSIFSNPPPQCSALNRQIDQQRNALERMQNDFERLNGGTTERAAQRQSLLIALGDNNCGPQYRSAALRGQRGGFFDRLFGGSDGGGAPAGGVEGDGLSAPPSGPMGSNFKTICVRTCDGYYFPISFSTSSSRFSEDAQTCQRMCPAAEVSLYAYHNPGEEVSQAVSVNGGQSYSALPTAFSYRKALTPSCSCRRPGESWAEALKAVGGNDNTVAPGDVVVTEQNAKRLSQPRAGADSKAPHRDPRTGKETSKETVEQPSTSEQRMVDAPGVPDPGKRDVRTVGPRFLPAR